MHSYHANLFMKKNRYSMQALNSPDEGCAKVRQLGPREGDLEMHPQSVVDQGSTHLSVTGRRNSFNAPQSDTILKCTFVLNERKVKLQ